MLDPPLNIAFERIIFELHAIFLQSFSLMVFAFLKGFILLENKISQEYIFQIPETKF